MVNTKRPVLIASLFLFAGTAFSQPVEKEPAAVVELGVAPGWSLKDGGSSIGPTVGLARWWILVWLTFS